MERKINVRGNEINILSSNNEEDYICITDMARYKNPERTGFVTLVPHKHLEVR